MAIPSPCYWITCNVPSVPAQGSMSCSVGALSDGVPQLQGPGLHGICSLILLLVPVLAYLWPYSQ